MRNDLLPALDAAAGVGFLVVAVLARRVRRTSALAAATGVLWLVGDAVPALTLAHRGPLTHLLLSYPSGRLRTRTGLVVVVCVDVVSVIVPWGQLHLVTLVAAAAVGIAIVRETGTPGERRLPGPVWPARAALSLVWSVLVVSSVARLSGHRDDVASLLAYELAVVSSVGLLVFDRLHTRRRSAVVAALAAGLEDAPVGSIRDVVAEVLHDPTLRLAFSDPTSSEDHALREGTSGPSVVGSTSGRPRGQLRVREGDRELAVVEHDPSVLRDPELRTSVSTLVRLAVRNHQLAREGEQRIAEVDASRRRLVTVADEERDDLEARLQSRVLDRIDRVAELLDSVDDADHVAGQIAGQARACADEVRSFARGMHPRVIEEAGLGAALAELTTNASAELVISGLPRSLPREAEVAIYYVCAEALTNTMKYAHAKKAAVRVEGAGDELVVIIEDDGIGGVTLAASGGLGGLRDRLEALGGRLSLVDLAAGTRIEAVVPIR
jgi:signal transduction histidine kinase